MKIFNTTSAALFITGVALMANTATAKPLPDTLVFPIATRYEARQLTVMPNIGVAVYPYLNPMLSLKATNDPLRFFSISNEPEVTAFLASNPEIAPKLDDTYTNIQSFFPESTSNMRILNDPEIENGQVLGIYIQVKMEPEAAVYRLHDFWEQWMFNNLAGIMDKVLIDVEFA